MRQGESGVSSKQDGDEHGPRVRTNTTWLRRVESKMNALGWERVDLSERSGVGLSEISKILDWKNLGRASNTIGPISDALGIPLPGDILDEEWMAVGARLRDLRPLEYEEYLRALRSWLAAVEAEQAAKQALYQLAIGPKPKK